jgi:hypothetical protein
MNIQGDVGAPLEVEEGHDRQPKIGSAVEKVGGGERVPLYEKPEEVETGNPYLQNSPGEIMRMMRPLIDEKDELDSKTRAINNSLELMKNALKSKADELGIDKFSDSEVGLSITIAEKSVVNWNRERFEEICKELVEGGYAHCLYRQFSTGKLEEVIRKGGRLPEGMEIDTIRVVNTRRI